MVVVPQSPTTLPTPVSLLPSMLPTSPAKTWVTSNLGQSCTDACVSSLGAGYSCYLPAMWQIDSLAKTQALGCTGTIAWDADHLNGEPTSGWEGNVPFIDIQIPDSCYFNIPGQSQSTCGASSMYRHRFCACIPTQRSMSPTGNYFSLASYLVCCLLLVWAIWYAPLPPSPSNNF